MYIVFGEPELAVFETAIREDRGLSLQEIAEREGPAEALRAITVGQTAVLLTYRKIEGNKYAVDEAEREIKAEQRIPVISEKDDGADAFRAAVQAEVEESWAWHSAALASGQAVIVATPKDPNQSDFIPFDDQVRPIVTIRPS